MTERALDFSYLDVGAECERKGYYRNHRRIEPKERFPPLLAGIVMHKALAALYAGGWDEASGGESGLGAAVEALHAAYAKSGMRAGGDFAYLTPGHLETVLRKYVKYWGEKEPFKVVRLIEAPLVAEIGVGSLFGGIPDLIGELDGELAVLDHKTTASYLGSNLYNRARFKHQLRGYALLGGAAMERPILRAVVNAIYLGEGATRTGSKASVFERYTFDFSQAQLEETKAWIRGRRERVQGMEGRPESEWLQNGGAHCGWCDYKALCEVSPEVRVFKEGLLYREREVRGALMSGADEEEKGV